MTGDGFRSLKRYRPGQRHEFEVWFHATEGWAPLAIGPGFGVVDDWSDGGDEASER
jgi:hypothetical protein